MRRAHELDWVAISKGGDPRLVTAQLGPAGPDPAPASKLKRPKLLTIVLLLAWLGWEAGGVVRVAIIGPPILSAMWGMK